jgi:hypothetical protein
MAGVETWTFFGAQSPKERVRRLGVNLGAPGDRKADDGTLWLEYPSVGGSSPAVTVKTEPLEPEWFRRHSSQVSGTGLNWVAASGAIGLKSVRIQLAAKGIASRKYTLRLHFMEPENVKPGERIFGVNVQGSPAIARLDVAGEAGGQNRSLVKEIVGVEAADELVVDLTLQSAERSLSTLLSGIEIQAEGW